MPAPSRLIPLLAALLLVQACSTGSRKTDKSRNAGKDGASADQAADTLLPGETEVTEASLRGKEFKSASTLKNAPFDYDKALLGEEALSVLKENAEWLKANPKVEIQVQGHCDERGTLEYNLALGQNRARAVRDYYRALGISMRRMSTISYGREQPICSESNEDCWRTNRRAETRARVMPPESLPKAPPKKRRR